MSLPALLACLTLDQAAVAALDAALPLSAEYEHGGALYVQDGCHGFTPPQTSGSSYTINLRIKLPPGAHLAGIYHTHTDDPHVVNATFSEIDVITQRALRVPSYIADVGTGKVFALDKSERINMRKILTSKVTFGREVCCSSSALGKR